MKKDKLKKYLKSFVIFTIVASLSVSISGCSKKEEFPLSLTNFCFDTTITITIYEYAGESEAQDIINECFGLCNHYDKMFSTTKKDSDISKINQSKTKGCKVNHVVSDVIKDSIKYSKKSKGAFDVTIGELSDMWNVTGDNPTVPDDKKIKEAIKHVGYKNIKCEDEKVTLKDGETRLDLGSIVKGFVADKLKSYMISEGVKSGIIDLGGNILTIGGKSDDEPFVIGIKNPFYNNDIAPIVNGNEDYIKNNDEYCLKLDVSDKSVVTSGIYERYFKKDDKIYHHILDTSTGYPVDNDLASVTIISNSSEAGDALSTTAFIMGLKDGMNLINKTQKTEAVFVTKDGKIHMSKGLEQTEDGDVIIETTTSSEKEWDGDGLILSFLLTPWKNAT